MTAVVYLPTRGSALEQTVDSDSAIVGHSPAVTHTDPDAADAGDRLADEPQTTIR